MRPNALPALVLADRDSRDFGDFLGDVLPALLPIAGKTVLEHAIEDLWESGIRDVVIAAPVGDTTIAREIGDGTRFGLSVRYVHTPSGQWPAETLKQAYPEIPDELIVARGDLLRGRSVAPFVAATGPAHGTVGLRHAGIARLGRGAAGVNLLDASILASSRPEFLDATIELSAAGLSILDGPAALYEASLGAIGGRYVGLVPDGRGSGDSGLRLAARASVPRSAHIHGIVRIGRGADIHHGVELSGRVDIGDQCVIDDGAQITNSVVLPGTYVGRGVSLNNAIARGAWLYRVDLDDTQVVEDPLLLAGAGNRAAA